MHKSSMLRMEWFINNYIKEDGKKILEVGSYDVNGSYRKLFYARNVEYVGLDIEQGPNVDIVLETPYCWEMIENESFDYIISGQAFEHIEYPWVTIKEMYKKLKYGGIICIIAPNSTGEHRYPFDCYRFFADGLSALAKWANFDILDVSVAGIPDRNVSPEWYSVHNDVCLIARKNRADAEIINIPRLKYERRYNGMLDQKLSVDFLSRWIEQDSMEKVFYEFIEKEKTKKVYIYGQDCVGKMLYNRLKKNTNVEIEFLGQKLLDDEEIEIFDKIENNEIILISLLDHNRDLQRYLDTIYGNIPKYYIDELVDVLRFEVFFKEYEQIYLYGAGNFGEKYLDFLLRYGFKPKGFIVSEGKRVNENFCGLKVYELQEVQYDEKIGIIISVSSEVYSEVESNLIESGQKNYISALKCM